jgi:transposase
MAADTCQYRTILHACPPRMQCAEHGVRVVQLPWAEPGSRFTELFEALAIEWLKHASQQAVGDRLQLSWDEIHGIMERAVKRGLARRQAEEIPHLGVDEKAFRKGHKYLTLVNDLKRNRVLYVAEDREQSSLDGFWSTITAAQRDSIQAVALDMWDPYLASLKQHLPGAEEKAVFDKFHVAKHLGEAVDKVRRREELRDPAGTRSLPTRLADHPTGAGPTWCEQVWMVTLQSWEKPPARMFTNVLQYSWRFTDKCRRLF